MSAPDPIADLAEELWAAELICREQWLDQARAKIAEALERDRRRLEARSEGAGSVQAEREQRREATLRRNQRVYVAAELLAADEMDSSLAIPRAVALADALIAEADRTEPEPTRALIAAVLAEREACAQIVKGTDVVFRGRGYTREDDAEGTLRAATAAIRARGQP